MTCERICCRVAVISGESVPGSQTKQHPAPEPKESTIMKKKLLLAVLMAVIAPALWLGAGGSPGRASHGPHLGSKLAGGWLATLDLEGQVTEAMFNLTADGTFLMNGTLRPWDPNDGGWLGTRWNTTAHGSWKQTGLNQISVVAMLLVQDYNGETVLYETAHIDLTLRALKMTLEGSAEIQLIWPDTDPLNPDPTRVLVTLPATVTARPIR